MAGGDLLDGGLLFTDQAREGSIDKYASPIRAFWDSIMLQRFLTQRCDPCDRCPSLGLNGVPSPLRQPPHPSSSPGGIMLATWRAPILSRLSGLSGLKRGGLKMGRAAKNGEKRRHEPLLIHTGRRLWWQNTRNTIKHHRTSLQLP